MIHSAQFKIKDVQPTAEDESAKVKVKCRVNIHGVFILSSASIVERVLAPATAPSSTAAATANNVDETAAAQGEKMETDEQQQQPTVDAAAAATDDASEDAATTSNDGDKQQTADEKMVCMCSFIHMGDR